MEDKEFLMYRVSKSSKTRPMGINYRTYEKAFDAAVNRMKKSHETYYVFEVCEVINTVAEVKV